MAKIILVPSIVDYVHKHEIYGNLTTTTSSNILLPPDVQLYGAADDQHFRINMLNDYMVYAFGEVKNTQLLSVTKNEIDEKFWGGWIEFRKLSEKIIDTFKYDVLVQTRTRDNHPIVNYIFVDSTEYGEFHKWFYGYVREHSLTVVRQFSYDYGRPGRAGPAKYDEWLNQTKELAVAIDEWVNKNVTEHKILSNEPRAGNWQYRILIRDPEEAVAFQLRWG